MFWTDCQKQHDGACHPCQENCSLLSSRSLHLGGGWGPRPWDRLRLCFPDWFKLTSDCTADRSTVSPPVTLLQPQHSEHRCNWPRRYWLHRVRTCGKRSMGSAFLTAAWTSASIHWQWSFTQGTHGSRLDAAKKMVISYFIRGKG